MGKLLVMKEQLKNIYSKYEVYIVPLLKFITAFVFLLQINSKLGYMNKIDNVAIVLIVALMCSFLPYNTIVVVGAAFVLAHLYSLSAECAIVAGCLFLLLFLLYFRFSPKDTMVVVLMPICFMLNIPYVMPLAMGLIGTPASIVSVSCGVVVYYMIEHINANATTILGMTDAVAKFRFVVNGLLNNNLMLITIAAFAVAIMICYIIRRLSVDHSWTIAVIASALTNIVILLIGDLMFDTNISIFGTIIGTVISIGIVKVLQFFVFNVDYSRTETVQFEDDEYYYYVKAVPKISVAVPVKTLKKINTQKSALNTVKPTQRSQVTSRPTSGTNSTVGSRTTVGSNTATSSRTISPTRQQTSTNSRPQQGSRTTGGPSSTIGSRSPGGTIDRK